MKSSEIRRRFIDFFEKRGHKIIKSASLISSDEKGVTNPTLFNTAGMQPLIPYLLGKEHPAGKRLVDVQKCLRTVDIDDVGDNTHDTFFEMLGNWSLAGPGAISTLIVSVSQYPGLLNQLFISISAILVCICMGILLFFAVSLEKLFGKSGINIINRLGGLILAAISIEMLANGVIGLFPILKG